MKKWPIVLLVFASVSCFGQTTLSHLQKFCELGGQKAVTQGMNSTNEIQRSFPLCSVTVYASGTTTLVTIYSDNLSTPTPLANPFTANTDGSWGFWVPSGSCYDIVNSGGVTGDQFPAPFTYSNICPGVGGSGGGAGINCLGAINGALALWINPGSVGCDNAAGSDFKGDVFGQSFQALGAVNGFDSLTGGLSDPLGCPQTPPTPCIGLANTVYSLAPLTVATPFATRPPNTVPTPGQVPVVNTVTTVHGVPVVNESWLTPSSSSLTLQTNGTNNLSQVLLNLIQGSGITVTNGSGGNVTIAATGSGGTVTSLTATGPIVATPSPITGVGVFSCPTCVTSLPANYHTCVVTQGVSGTPLTNAQLGPLNNLCKVSLAGTLLEVTFNVDNASSTTNIQVRKRHCAGFTAGTCTSFTLTNLFSGALSAATTAFADACVKSSTSATCLDGTTSSSSVSFTTSALAQGDWLEWTSGTADTVTAVATVSFTWTN